MPFLGRFSQLLQRPQQLTLLVGIGFRFYSSDLEFEIKRITKIINDHPFPDQPIRPTFAQVIPSAIISTSFVENVLGRLFATHSNGLKAFEFFKFSLQCSEFCPSSDAFEKTLHILTRMRYFSKAWELIEEIQKTHPSLISLKSMSIMLSRIAKFQSFEETLQAFEKLEGKLSDGKQFGTDEFNLLLRAFCTQRQMKEAKSVFNKLYSRFSPTTKTMNILLLGFKESGDVTSVELFYHEMIRRGFKPDTITFNIIIDSYCKRGRFADGLRLLEEMEQVNCFPTLQTITTLIHGAGIAQNTTNAQQLFDEIPKRNLVPDSGAYNALMNAFIRSGNMKSATRLMDEMEENNLLHDNVTFHTMFLGSMKSSGIDGVLELYHKMISKKFVPKMPTVVMLMQHFCKNHKVDEALGFWRYLVESGYCPHSHAMDVLLRSLCSHGRVDEAFECSLQILERGRHLSKTCFRVLEKYLIEMGDEDKLKKLNQMIKKLQIVLPPSTGHAVGFSSFSQDCVASI
ncbi:pentatricopeptide repeat-containing protein At3g61360 [Cynara cardunculus var. scolymus]|uniref:Pentatricopeptide repeat-containing protein n=1 Tax=Cynara cardunculus var. scolymus TaxID=59895 RepID=A0A103Y4I2_CYNCS|nr:pentatricopeptide repeat-containing protein At3g61360 [Cynara cardunculus var. scolymus]KVI02365.1 Pentatricopeptide repeat-containing protein [Cynara cardunculus var. scolymus]